MASRLYKYLLTSINLVILFYGFKYILLRNGPSLPPDSPEGTRQVFPQYIFTSHSGISRFKSDSDNLKFLSVCIKFINNLAAKVLNIVRCSKSHRLKI